jgi:hypothetical protein
MRTSLHFIFFYASISLLLSGCTIFPSHKNVILKGRVLNSEGQPVDGAQVSYSDYKYRAFSMPGVGSTGFVFTDENGNYEFRLPKIHDTIDLSVTNTHCPGVNGEQTFVEKTRWSNSTVVEQDLESCNQIR